MMETHPSDTIVQREAESHIRTALADLLGYSLQPMNIGNCRLDGFADRDEPVCVEIWSHRGKADDAAGEKVMNDFGKLLLCERLLGKRCRKMFVTCDPSAVEFLLNSWRMQFANEFGIELKTVEIPAALRTKLENAQKVQGGRASLE